MGSVISGLGSGGNLNLGSMLGTTNGYNALNDGTSNTNIAGQQQLIAALQAQAAGQGANPAQAMLNQATNQNIAQNTGMIASQKGINPALAIRQASMNAANTGQQAAGQAASMQAQQQQAAQNNEAGVYSSIGNEALGANNLQAGITTSNTKNNASLIGGLIGGGSAAGAAALMAQGGSVSPNMMSDGGTPSLAGAEAFFNTQANTGVQVPQTSMPGKKAPGSSDDNGQVMAGGSYDTTNAAPAQMPMMNSSNTMMAAQGGLMKKGGAVKAAPGQEAKVSGDSYANDKVPALLSQGEGVIDRETMSDPGPMGQMARALMAHINSKKKSPIKGKYAEGGDTEVPESMQVLDQANQSSQDFSNSGLYNQQAQDNNLQTNNATSDYQQAQKDFVDAQNAAKNDPNETTLVSQKNAQASLDVAQQNLSKSAQMSASNGTSPLVSQQLSDQVPQSQGIPETQDQSAAIGSPLGSPDYLQGMSKAIGMQEAGAQGSAKAQIDLANQEAQLLKDSQAKQAVQDADYQTRSQAALKDIDDTYQSLKDGKIDPTHFWSSKSTGNKIGTAIALIAGGISSGLTGQANPASAVINKQIDLDTQSQVAEMDKKKNLMSYNMQKYGNLKDAYNMTKAMQLQAVTGQLQVAALNAQDPIVKARLMQEEAGFQAQKTNLVQQTMMTQAKMGLYDNQSPQTEMQAVAKQRIASALAPDQYKDMQSKYIPNVGMARVALTPDNRSEVTSLNALNDRVDQARDFQKNIAGNVGAISPENRATAENLKNSIGVELGKLYGLKRLNDTEYHNYMDQVGNIGNPNMGTAAVKLDDLKKQVQGRLDAVTTGLGVTPFAKSSKDNAALDWAKKNPTNPLAVKIFQVNGVK